MILSIAIFSCKDNSLEKQRNDELDKFNAYTRNHYADITPKASGLFYIELDEGLGDSIKIGDKVQIFFDLWTLDSLWVNGSGNFEPLEMEVQHPANLSYSAKSVEQLKSLNEALTYMKKGTRSRLIFDSALGFGQYGTYGILGFTSLMMEVEVYKVFPAQGPPQETE